MAKEAPILNPIRFYDPTRTPNYADRWPNMDNVSLYTEWQKGVNPTKFYKDFVLNQEITFQFRFDSEVTDQNTYVYKRNADGTFSNIESIIPVNISPSGWTGTPVYKYSWTPTETGVYYFDFTDADYLSDKFVVHNDQKYLKRLIEIEYTHYENRYGMVFVSGSTNVYTGKTYLQGSFLQGKPTNEISQFEDDPGEVTLLRSTPQRNAILRLDELHYTYLDMVNLIFSCSNIDINGIRYQNKETPTSEPIPNSDLVKITVDLFQRDNDFFIK